MSGRRSVGTSYCKELVTDFEQLAIDLALPLNYEKHGRAMTSSIFKHLQRNAWRYDVAIDRVRLGGSNGKGTGISYEDLDGDMKNSDFDLVLFVDTEEPPFEDTLKAFLALLKEMKFSSVKKTRISVQCTYNSPVGPIKFDVLPAENHVTQRTNQGTRGLGQTQARLAFRNLRRILNGAIDQDEIRLHSASFCEETVDVIRSYCENTFYLHVVRLAKYWNSQLDINGYVSGRSAIVELMAINCQRGKRNKCLISGFRRFLEAMADFNNQYVILGNEPQNDPCYELVKFTYGPVIIDPVNRYNNMAHGMEANVIDIFETQARQTLDLLDGLRDLDGYESIDNPIDEIFSHKY